jgi:membrane associated rhomboid family serine protease
VNYSIIALNIGVFIYMAMLAVEGDGEPVRRDRFAAAADPAAVERCYGFDDNPDRIERFYCRWSFQPKEWFDYVQGEPERPGQSTLEVVLTILTSVYLHAGFLHILGNMLFLWVFGDNVEDRLGHLGYLLFYSASGVFASLAQGVIDTESIVPNVGASGAVAGVLGAYIVYFPKATVTTLIPIVIVLIPFPVPAWIMIGIWFLQNLLSGFATLATVDAGDGGIAFFAHIGGFVFGALIVLLFLRGVGRRRAPPLARW